MFIKGAYRVDNVALTGVTLPQVIINEFHYANTTVSKTGFVEVSSPVDFTALNSVVLTLYNSAGNSYGTYDLSTFKLDARGTYENEKIYYLDLPAGLAEPVGGFSLSASNNLIQFISYGGVLKPSAGPAAGATSQDVGVTETLGDGANNSIFLTTVNARTPSPPIWTKGTTNTNTKGLANWEENQILPVELLYFNALPTSKEVNLNWATASELNNDYFLVEKSLDATLTFLPVAKIKGMGNSQQVVKYYFTDEKSLGGMVYYRLKQVD